MNQQDLNFLIKKIEEIEQQIQNIQLMYKPLGREEHINLTDYLDEVEKRLKDLEK